MTGGDASMRELRRDADALREEGARLMAQVRAVGRRAAQLAALRSDEVDFEGRIAALERVLDFDRAAAHLEGAVARAGRADSPVPHLLIPDLFPPEMYGAFVDAIPARVFFEAEDAEGAEMRLPPRMAPAHALVAWMFLTDLALRALSPALLARLEEPVAALARARFPDLPPFGEWGVEVTLSQGRIVRRTPVATAPPVPDRPWDLLTTVVCLARPGDTEEGGSGLGPKGIPFRANTALTFVGTSTEHVYAPVPAGTERYTYEFGIGPTQQGRRALSAMGKKISAKV